MDSTITFEYVKTNGITLHVAQAGDPNAPLVLLLHGFPEFWYGWREQIPYLVAQGFRVWAPDQRGYNYSDKPRGIENYGLDLLSADVIGLMDAAGVEQAFVVGHDWGGAVAWWTALHYPERVRKQVVLNLPHPVVLGKHLSSNPRQQIMSWYVSFFQIPVIPESLLTMGGAWNAMNVLFKSSKPGTFTDEDVPHYTQAWLQPNAMTSMINWYRALVQKRPALKVSPRCKVPTMLLWGEKDIALNRDMAAPSIALCDDGRLELFPDTSHWIQHEQPARVNALIAEYLHA